MRRRSRAGGVPVKTRRQKTATRKRGNAPKIAVRRSPPAGQETEVARLTRELHEGQEQQRATSEILSVVARSRTDVQSVLDTVCKSAAHLCEAYDASIWRPDGDRLLLAAHHGPITQIESVPLVRGSALGRSVLDTRTVHILDLQTQGDEFPVTSKNARRLGFRTGLFVPLMREGVAIGVIALRRAEAQLFTERQVALLQTFADQAVIAMTSWDPGKYARPRHWARHARDLQPVRPPGGAQGLGYPARRDRTLSTHRLAVAGTELV
jgi:transcriptional regulator with GAF, ATPase, and Fis domain